MEHKASLATESSEISLRLEKYDDIFSDFDIRPHSSRALSIDFIDEIKRASYDKNDTGIELVIHIPEQKRSESQELAIKERLVGHFKKHYRLLVEEKHRTIRLGVSMVVTGIICMIAATLVLFKSQERDLVSSFLVVFLEPAAWFLLWEGMDQIIFHSKSLNPDLKFYKKMSHARGQIHFKSY